MRNRHNWEYDDSGISICKRCGMYRCTTKGRPNGVGRPRDIDVEYSAPDGAVIGVNPDRVPECES